MKTAFLYQGLSECEDSVGKVLLESFSDSEFDKFLCFVAFARQSGVNLLSDPINSAKGKFNQIRFLVGVDQRGTSKEALEALLNLGVETSVYYTPSRITFHPKMYMFEGNRKHRIIVGSSNLTQKGLFQNLEVSLQVDFTLPDDQGQDLLDQIHEYMRQFLENKCNNVKELTTELIDTLVKVGLVPNEKEIQGVDTKKSEAGHEASILGSIFPTVRLQRLPDLISVEVKASIASRIKNLLNNYPEGLELKRIYDKYEERFTLTQKEKEQTQWGNPDFIIGLEQR